MLLLIAPAEAEFSCEMFSPYFRVENMGKYHCKDTPGQQDWMTDQLLGEVYAAWYTYHIQSLELNVFQNIAWTGEKPLDFALEESSTRSSAGISVRIFKLNLPIKLL
jgi:hypothetical protein